MRKASAATVALIVAIALYFTLSWGVDGLRALASPNYGLDDVWRSQLVFDAGRLLHLTPIGLIKLAAFFAAMKVAVAGICGLHIVDRLRSFAGVLQPAPAIVARAGLGRYRLIVARLTIDVLREHSARRNMKRIE